MYNLFVLDVAFSPFDIIFIALSNLWWLFAIAAVLGISAIIGIVLFAKKKESNKENKK